MAIKHMSSTQVNARHSIHSYGNGVGIDATEVKGNETLSEVGTLADRFIDFGLDMLSNNNGGMVLIKNSDGISNWRLSNTLFPNGWAIDLNLTDALTSRPTSIKDFSTTGATLGTATTVNGTGNDIAEFGFQTTHKKVRTHTGVKSVVFDIADNWGSGSYSGIRSIEFYIGGSLITLTSGFTAYATSSFTGTAPEYAFDTSLPKTGSYVNNSWVGLSPTNVRLVIVFDIPQAFDRLIVNNYVNSAVTDTNRGVKTTKIHTSTDAITSTVYDEAIANSELIFNGVIAEHPATDTIDDRGYCGVEWAYNPASGFFMLTHDGDGGDNDFPITNVTGKPIIFCSTKRINIAADHRVYTDKSGINSYMNINDTSSVMAHAGQYYEMSGDNIIFGTGTQLNQSGLEYFTWGFVGEDLGHLTPWMTGVEGSSACTTLTDGGTFDCGMLESEVAFIIIKNLIVSSSWTIVNTASGLGNYLQLNTTNIESTLDGLTPSFVGTQLTVDSGWINTNLILVIGKDGLMPSGQTINITANILNPFVASIAHGFSAGTGQKNITIAEDANKALALTGVEGKNFLTVDSAGTYSLDTTEPDFDSTPGVMRGTTDKLLIADVQVLDGDIVDIDLMPVGGCYETEWFPVESNTLYSLPNRFKSNKVEFEIWWNSLPTDVNKRGVTGYYYITPTSEERSRGAWKRVNDDELIVGTSLNSPFYSETSADPASSTVGFYKLIVRRNY